MERSTERLLARFILIAFWAIMAIYSIVVKDGMGLAVCFGLPFGVLIAWAATKAG